MFIFVVRDCEVGGSNPLANRQPSGLVTLSCCTLGYAAGFPHSLKTLTPGSRSLHARLLVKVLWFLGPEIVG